MKERLGKLFQELKDHLHVRFALRFCDTALTVYWSLLRFKESGQAKIMQKRNTEMANKIGRVKEP